MAFSGNGSSAVSTSISIIPPNLLKEIETGAQRRNATRFYEDYPALPKGRLYV